MAKLKENAITGIFIGVGAAVLAPVVVPVLVSVVKPLAKAAIKGGILFFEKGKEMAAEAGEIFEDLTAEARAELAAEATTAGAAAAAGGGKAVEPETGGKDEGAP